MTHLRTCGPVTSRSWLGTCENQTSQFITANIQEVIGASQGEETNLVRVEWNPDPTGAYHGRPISEKELLEELRAINPAELAAYRLRKKGLQTRRWLTGARSRTPRPRSKGALFRASP